MRATSMLAQCLPACQLQLIVLALAGRQDPGHPTSAEHSPSLADVASEPLEDQLPCKTIPQRCEVAYPNSITLRGHGVGGGSDDSYLGFLTPYHGSFYSVVPKPHHSCLQRGQPSPQPPSAQSWNALPLKVWSRPSSTSVTWERIRNMELHTHKVQFELLK